MGLFNHLGEETSETQVAGITNFDIVLSNYAKVDQLEKYLHRSKKQNNEMKTDLNMSDNRITNLPNPKNAADAVSRKYVNDRLKVFLRNKNLDNIPEQFKKLEQKLDKKFVSQETELLNLSKAIQENRRKMVEINQELENEIELLNAAKRELEEADEDIKDDLILELGNKINEGFTNIQERIANIRNTMVDNNEIQEKINEVNTRLQERLTQLSIDVVNIRDTLSNNNVSTQASIQKLTEDFENLQGNLIQIQADIVEIHNNENARLQERLTQLTTNIVNIRDTLSNNNVSTQASILKLTEDFEQLRDNLIQIQADIVEVHNNDITLLETKINNLDVELQTQIDELKTELDTFDTKIDRKLRRRVGDIKTEITNELAVFRREVNDLISINIKPFLLFTIKERNNIVITIESSLEFILDGDNLRKQKPNNYIYENNNYNTFSSFLTFDENVRFRNHPLFPNDPRFNPVSDDFNPTNALVEYIDYRRLRNEGLKVNSEGLYIIKVNIEFNANPPIESIAFKWGNKVKYSKPIENKIQTQFSLYLHVNDNINIFPIPTSNVTTFNINDFNLKFYLTYI